MEQWTVETWLISGQYTGARVVRSVGGEIEVAFAEVAKDGAHSSALERQRVEVAATAVAKFLNEASSNLGADFFAEHKVVKVLSQTFRHFQDGEPVTVEAVRQIGREYNEMEIDPGPQEIEFNDQNGDLRKIVYDKGDRSVGINGGWIIAEDADWIVVPEAA